MTLRAEAVDLESDKLFQCSFCVKDLTIGEKGACESYDEDFCVSCHTEVCGNQGLCEIAGGWYDG